MAEAAVDSGHAKPGAQSGSGLSHDSTRRDNRFSISPYTAEASAESQYMRGNGCHIRQFDAIGRYSQVTRGAEKEP